MHDTESPIDSGSSMDPRDGQTVARQHTLKNAIHCSGIGLHSGRKVGMTLRPAPPDSGIVFRRSDLSDDAPVAASLDCIVETPRRTSLQNDHGVTVATVEHLMSAFSGCGIDNAEVELNGPEVPAMDGSAAPFVFLLECAGRLLQKAPRRALKILRRVAVESGDRSVSLSPGPGLSIHCEIDFDGAGIGHQEWFVAIDGDTYKREVARARTFGLLSEVEELRAHGLAHGGSLDNAVVIDGDRIVNEDGLRFHNEPVRHKVLDMIGDLYLAGGPIIGHASSIRGGHALTLRLLRRLFADRNAWRWTTVTEDELNGLSPPVEPVMKAALAARA